MKTTLHFFWTIFLFVFKSKEAIALPPSSIQTSKIQHTEFFNHFGYRRNDEIDIGNDENNCCLNGKTVSDIKKIVVSTAFVVSATMMTSLPATAAAPTTISTSTPWLENTILMDPSIMLKSLYQKTTRQRQQDNNNNSPFMQAVREIYNLQDLQDERLEMCADRGPYWEQCMFGGEEYGRQRAQQQQQQERQRQRGGVFDYQLVSPEGAWEPKVDTKKIPTW